ncbi:MAG: four helix bundle protein [Candidatus Omnitrophota bacterium]
MIKTFRDLIVWQKAHYLVLEIYKITNKFPSEERYGLVAQLRRSAVSIPTNIVEGFKRKSKKDYAHFINIAEGSLEETKYHIILANDLGYFKEIDFDNLNNICDEIGKMLYSLQRKLTTYDLRPTAYNLEVKKWI